MSSEEMQSAILTEMRAFNSKVSDLEKKMDAHAKKTDAMYMAIVGDDKMEVSGLAKRVKSVEQYIEADKKWKWTIRGALMTGAGGIAHLLHRFFG